MVRQVIKKARGFTLIELMITVAIVAILAAIAYPSYQNSIKKSRRTEVKAAIQNVAAEQERFYYKSNAYTRDLRNLGYSIKIWNNSENGFYRFRVQNNNCNTTTDVCTAFRLRAQPLNTSAQWGDPWWYELWSDGRMRRRSCPNDACGGSSWINDWDK